MARVAKRRVRREAADGESPRKRAREVADEIQESEDDGPPETPTKQRRVAHKPFPSQKSLDDIYEVPDDNVLATPASGKKRGRPRKQPVEEKEKDELAQETETPSKRRRTVAFTTPVRPAATPRVGAGMDTPTRRTLADRSARRKSTRAMIDRVVRGEEEDDLFFGEDESEGEEGEGEGEGGEEGEKEGEKIEATPKRRGRPPKVRAAVDSAAPKRGPGRPRKNPLDAPTTRAASPPRDLPAHEQYFFQNRPGAAGKTSHNTLASLRLLTHEEFFQLRSGETDSDDGPMRFLEGLHAQSFAQWAFELAQGFSVCLYGCGAKQRLLRQFAGALHAASTNQPTRAVTVMVEGHAAAAASALRTIFAVVAAALGIAAPLPAGAAAAERTLLGWLDEDDGPAVNLLVDGIDAPPLRRPATQAALARVAAHPRIHLLAAADTPGCALLWDGAARAALNMVFHDATTFARRPPAADATVDDVHALLGRRARRVGGPDGAAFVLRSLPENARSLFQLLVAEVLGSDGRRPAREEEEEEDDDDDNYDADADESIGLEYRMLYNKAVEEFICSSEMAFRTLLKEFHDHQMVTSRKDAFGTELLSLPFRRDELEALLEELMA